MKFAKKSFLFSFLTTLYFLLFGSITNLNATAGIWINPAGGFWDVGANWSTNPIFPDAPGDTAAFVGNLPSIDSNSNITIGTLILDSVTIQFNNNHTLTFDAGPNQKAKIFSANICDLNTPMILNSPLEITAGQNLSFDKGISGADSNNYILLNSNFSNFNFLSTNTFTGKTFLETGTLVLESPGGGSIPADLQTQVNTLVTTNVNNQFSASTNFFLNGVFDINSTQQQFNKLTIGSEGFATDNSNTPSGVLTLLASTVALRFGGNSKFQIPSLILAHHGSIVYDPSVSRGQASIFNSGLFPFVDINLSAGNVDLVIPSGNNANFDMQMSNVKIHNGILHKQGNGKLFFFSNVNAVPIFFIEEGDVFVGFGTVDCTGPTTLVGGTLGGRGTFGLAGSASVTNSSGTIIPGKVATNGFPPSVGTFTISGSYRQEANGSLLIKAASSAAADKLVVDLGQVNLSGKLIFDALPASDLKAGDQFIIIDNTNSNTHIQGTFSSIEANIPPTLAAKIEYDPNQVIVKIVSACTSK